MQAYPSLLAAIFENDTKKIQMIEAMADDEAEAGNFVNRLA